MKPMDKYDYPLLRPAGFVAGFSGHSWFAEDKDGNTWQAYLDDKSVFQFRKEEASKWGAYKPMDVTEFASLFGLDSDSVVEVSLDDFDLDMPQSYPYNG